jgi:hypothetical protein
MPGRLRALATGAKILYTAFVLATLAGLFVSWRLYGAAVGDAGPGAYYGGATVTAPQEAPKPASDGIELAPEDAKPRVIVEQISERKLLEVTHFHLFTIPVYVLILAHLWLLAKVPPWAQNGGVVLAVVTSGLHIALPWLARGKPGIAAWMGLSGAAMLLTLGVMALGSMIDMWLPSPKPPAGLSTAEKLAALRKKNGDRGSPA